MNDTRSDSATVLVVEDDVDLAETFAIWLGDSHDVSLAHRADDALDAYSADVDVVLLDRRLPERSGGDVLEELTSAPGDSLVAMVTAVEPDLDLAELPVDDYLVKPVEREELRTVVTDLHERHGYDDTVRELAARVARLETLDTYADPSRVTDSEAVADLVNDIDLLRGRGGDEGADPVQAALEATDATPRPFTD